MIRWIEYCATRILLLGILGLSVIGLSIGCATRLAPPQLEGDAAFVDELADKGLDSMRRYQERLRPISDRLRLHGTEMCDGETVPYLGVIVERINQGPPSPLSRVRRQRGIRFQPTVVRVISDSPAARAGLRPNDVIHSFNGRRTVDGSGLIKDMKSSGSQSPVFEIERDGERIEVSLAYQAACTLPAAFSPDGPLSTWTTDHFQKSIARVVVSQGLMEFVSSDDELAILIGHEMAHLIIDADKLTRDIEEQADRLSLEFAQRAGYDIGGAVALWERLAVQRPWMITTAEDSSISYHGDVAARVLLMGDVIKELELADRNDR